MFRRATRGIKRARIYVAWTLVMNDAPREAESEFKTFYAETSIQEREVVIDLLLHVDYSLQQPILGHTLRP